MKEIVKELESGLTDPLRSGLHHIGNSTHWLVFENTRILTDPWLAEPAEHLLKHSCPPVPFPRNPDIVLISHEHDDHFDPEALKLLDRKTVVIAPSGKVSEKLKKMDFKNTIPANPGDSISTVNNISVDVVKGKHNVPEICFRVNGKENSFFFGGDTMITKEILAMADERPVPFVILPGEHSRLLGFRFVMNPGEAVSLAKRFRASKAVLTHHEQVVAVKSLLRFIVSIKKVQKDEFPDWFVVPSPGQFVSFPWEENENTIRESLS